MNSDFTGMFSRSSGTVSTGDLLDKNGVIATLDSLDIDLEDDQLISNLQNRINSARDDWDDSSKDGYNLSEKRRLNKLYFDGDQIQNQLKPEQIPYSENQIWVGWSAVLAYLTSRTAQPNVYPSSESATSKRFAVFFEKVLRAHNEMFEFKDLSAKVVNDAGLSYIGGVKLEFNPDYGEHGEIVPELLDPENLVVDYHTAYGKNPEFVSYTSRMTASEMIHRWKDKKEDILKLSSIELEEGKSNLDVILSVTEVWMTYYDSNFDPHEGVVYYSDNVLLEKIKNPNYSYVNENLNILKIPPKPFVFCNIASDGRLLIDKTSPVQQGRIMQDFLNLAGRHSLESSLRSNPTIVVNGGVLNEEDAVNAEKLATQSVITLTDVPQGSNAAAEFGVVPAASVSPELLAQKQDLRTQTLAMIGAPNIITGTGDLGDTEATLGQSEIKKDQAQGRMDLMTRAIEKFYTEYYRLLAHMMSVWYVDKHSFTSSSNSGYKRIFISREMIDTKIEIHVEGNSTLPVNKAEQQSIAEGLLENKAISLLDYYKISGINDPQELYDNYIQFTHDPTSLARKESSEEYEFKAEQLLERFEDEPTVEISDSSDRFIRILRDLTISDEFQEKSKQVQNRFNNYLSEVINDNLKHKIIDNAAQQGVMALEPDLKFTPTQIGAVVQAEGVGAAGGASDPSIPGTPEGNQAMQAVQPPTGQTGNSMQPPMPQPPIQPPQPVTTPQADTAAQAPPASPYQNSQGQVVAPNGEVIDPNHFYTVQELAQMGLSPDNLKAEAIRAQQQITPPQNYPPQIPPNSQQNNTLPPQPQLPVPLQ